MTMLATELASSRSYTEKQLSIFEVRIEVKGYVEEIYRADADMIIYIEASKNKGYEPCGRGTRVCS